MIRGRTDSAREYGIPHPHVKDSAEPWVGFSFIYLLILVYSAWLALLRLCTNLFFFCPPLLWLYPKHKMALGKSIPWGCHIEQPLYPDDNDGNSSIIWDQWACKNDFPAQFIALKHCKHSEIRIFKILSPFKNIGVWWCWCVRIGKEKYWWKSNKEFCLSLYWKPRLFSFYWFSCKSIATYYLGLQWLQWGFINLWPCCYKNLPCFCQASLRKITFALKMPIKEIAFARK